MRWIVAAKRDSWVSSGKAATDKWYDEVVSPAFAREDIEGLKMGTLPSLRAALITLPDDVPAEALLTLSKGRFRIVPDLPLRQIESRPSEGTTPDVPLPKPTPGQGEGARLALLDLHFVEEGAVPEHRLTRFVATDHGVEPEERSPPGNGRHGSDMAAIAAGDRHSMAPKAELTAIRLAPWSWNMYVALDYIRRETRAHLVYTGTIAVDDSATTVNELDLVRVAIGSLADANIPFFAAAGNDSSGTIAPPGSFSTAITVGLYNGAKVASSRGAVDKPTLITDWPQLYGYDDVLYQGSTSYSTACLAGFVAAWIGQKQSLGRSGILELLASVSVLQDGIPRSDQGMGLFRGGMAKAVVFSPSVSRSQRLIKQPTQRIEPFRP